MNEAYLRVATGGYFSIAGRYRVTAFNCVAIGIHSHRSARGGALRSRDGVIAEFEARTDSCALVRWTREVTMERPKLQRLPRYYMQIDTSKYSRSANEVGRQGDWCCCCLCSSTVYLWYPFQQSWGYSM